MRNLFFGFIFCLFLISNLANAQVSSGQIFIGGDFSLSATTFEGNSNQNATSFSLVPNVGFMLSDRFALGLGLGYRQAQVSTPTGVNTINTITNGTFQVAPFLRYYVPTSSEQFAFFAQFRAELGFGSTRNEQLNTTTNVRTSTSAGLTTADIFISPNFAFFPTPHWAIELGVRGIGVSITDPEGNNNTTTTFELGLNSFAPRIGLQYFF
ncbi:MAG TPA: hypothetical protein DCM08_05080 [Microscillaceae bacterium]|nr:hypothetical protein [Microscillaceae bacterium]